MENCNSETKYEATGSKLEYRLENAMPIYSARSYGSRKDQGYSSNYHQGI